MKKFVSLLASLILAVICCFSFTACGEDLVDVKINISIYNPNKSTETVTLDYTFYRHLAPESVDQFISLANSGHYTNAPYFHLSLGEIGNTALVGAYKYDDSGKLVKNTSADYITGEYAIGGVQGSDLKDNVGNILAFRWWNAGETLKDSGHDTNTMGTFMSNLVGTQFDDTANNSTTVAVVGVIAEDSVLNFKKVAGKQDSGNKCTSWENDNVETYHVFYFVNPDTDEFTEVFLTDAEYGEKVEDGEYIYKTGVDPDDNTKTIDYKVAIFDPSSDDVEGERALSKYQEHTVSVPKYEYRVVISSIEIND